MLKWQTAALAIASSFCLTACFLSGASKIETGLRLAGGDVLFCTDDDPPCQTGTPKDDGYIIRSSDPEEEDVFLRFEVLTESEAGTIYVGETELKDEDETAWAYLLARASETEAADLPAFDIVLPACNDGDAEVQSGFGIIRTDSYSCEVGDFEDFRNYLIATYADRFGNPAFWRGEDGN